MAEHGVRKSDSILCGAESDSLFHRKYLTLFLLAQWFKIANPTCSRLLLVRVNL